MRLTQDVDRRRLLVLTGGGLLAAASIWLIVRSVVGGEEPAEGPASPAVAEVVQLEARKDVAGLANSVQHADEAAARRAILAVRTLAPPDRAVRVVQRAGGAAPSQGRRVPHDGRL